MATTTRKTGDTRPIIATIREATKRGVPLTGATVRIHVVAVTLPDPPPDPEPGFTGRLCTILDAATGLVSAAVGASDLTRGVYRMAWEITWNDGSIETVPTEGYEDLVVEDGLG